MRLKILNRYILKEMTGPFLIGLAVYTLLFLIQLLFQLANLVIQQGLSAGVSFLIFLLSLPGLLAYTIPVALLLGTIIAYGRLSSDSEIIAIRASGIRGGKLLIAPLYFAGAATVVMLVFNVWLIPYARFTMDRIQGDSTQAIKLVRLLRPGVFFDRIPGVLLYARRVNEQKARYEDVLVFQKEHRSEDILTLARYGRTVSSPASGTLQFLLEDGETVRFDRRDPGKVQRSSFKEQTLTVQTSGGSTGGGQRSLSEYTTSELLGRLKLPPQSKDPELIRKDRYAWLYELNRRFAASLAVLFFVLVGVPLGMVNVRGGKGAGFSLSLIVLLGYWILNSALGDLALAGRMHPWLAAWLPDILLLVAGLWLMRIRNRMTAPGWIRLFLLLFPARRAPQAGPDRASKGSVRLTRGVPILDRYVFKRMLRFLVLISASIILLDWLIEARGLSEFVTNRHQFHLLMRYLVDQTPGILMMLAPFAVLMTVLVTFGVLERSNEVIAIKASGISLYRLAMPAVILGCLACVFLWSMSEAVVPGASRTAQTLRDRIKGYTSRNVASAMDVWLFAPDRQELFHYNHYDAKTKGFQGFSIYKLDKTDFRLESRFFAKNADFSAPDTLRYTDGWRWRRAGSKTFEMLPHGRLGVGVPKSYFVIPAFMEARYFNSHDLRKLIGQLQERGYPTYQQRMDYYQKYSDAAAPLVLLIIGLPFAFMTGRRGSLYGIAIALTLVIAYYALSAIFNSIGVMLWLDPSLAAWTPTILFALAGGYLLLNIRT